jgi:hypothetical protein
MAGSGERAPVKMARQVTLVGVSELVGDRGQVMTLMNEIVRVRSRIAEDPDEAHELVTLAGFVLVVSQPAVHTANGCRDRWTVENGVCEVERPPANAPMPNADRTTASDG